MKYCPQCQTTYTDDLLKYCLKDGAPLGEVFAPQTPQAELADEKTVVTTGDKTVPSIRRVEPIRVPVEQNPPVHQTAPVESAPAQNRQYVESPVAAMQPEARKTKTGSVVALTILGTLLFLGIAGVGAMLYFRNQKPEIVANVNKAPANRSVNMNSANVQTANQNANANLAENSPTPTPTAAPKPTPDERQAGAIADDIKDAVDEWKNATENLDIGGQLSQYAETVDYYRSGRVSRARVRADKDRAFGIYNNVNIDISNLEVTPDESGEQATALFDKEWNFEGDTSNSSGKVRQQLTFSRIDGKWLITGERDLRVYYVNN